MFTDSRRESSEPKVTDDTVFQFCWVWKKVFFNWSGWSLPRLETHWLASRLSGPAAHWSDQIVFDKRFNHPSVMELPLILHATSVMCRSTLSPWAEQNTDNHSQPNSVWLSVSMSYPFFPSSMVWASRAGYPPIGFRPENVYPGLWFDHGRG